jgi:hypothetical protein
MNLDLCKGELKVFGGGGGRETQKATIQGPWTEYQTKGLKQGIQRANCDFRIQCECPEKYVRNSGVTNGEEYLCKLFSVTLGWSLSPQQGTSSDCGWRNSLQLWRVAANILNKQSRIHDKGWSSSLGVALGANNPAR